MPIEKELVVCVVRCDGPASIQHIYTPCFYTQLCILPPSP